MSNILKLELLTRLKHRLEEMEPDLTELIKLVTDKEGKGQDDIELVTSLLSTVESIFINNRLYST